MPYRGGGRKALEEDASRAPDKKPPGAKDADAEDNSIGDGCGRGILVIFIIAWLAWIGISGYWRELLEPFANLLRVFGN